MITPSARDQPVHRSGPPADPGAARPRQASRNRRRTASGEPFDPGGRSETCEQEAREPGRGRADRTGPGVRRDLRTRRGAHLWGSGRHRAPGLLRNGPREHRRRRRTGRRAARRLRDKPRYVRRALDRDQLAVQSFQTDDAREFHALLPDVPIGILDADRLTDTELVRLSRWADQADPQYTVTDQDLVDRVRALGMDINVWTVDEPGAMRTMPGLGVDGIITDFPQSLTQRQGG
ncbi:glycerophosphodiester phosphodiesterase [Streptomyces sp. NPDC058794]|uniref:glycerophosphodiester phosphodiesterase n=1 Tax=Streptomyces sp. NPDC058794 TaxID=3346636 RepID=UPI0036D16BBD